MTTVDDFALRLAGTTNLRFTALLLASSVAVGIGVAHGFSTPALVTLAVVIGLMCLVYPYLGATALVLAGFSVEWLIALHVLPSRVQSVQDVLALGLIAAMVLRTRRRQSAFRDLIGVRWFAAFIVFAMLGVAINAADPVAALVGLRNLWVFVPLAVAPLAFEWSELECRRFVYLLLGLVFLQPVVAVGEFLSNPKSFSGDIVGGTLGGSASGAVTALMIATVTLLIGMYVYKVWKPGLVALAVVALSIPPALNETKVFFVVAPLVWGLTLLTRVRRGFFSIVVALMFATAAIFLVFQSYQAFYGANLAGTDVAATLWNSQAGTDLGQSGVMKRLPAVMFAVNEDAQQPATLFFGFGSGSLTISSLVGATGYLAQRYGILLSDSSFAVRLLLETGFLGLIAFLGFIGSVFVAGVRLERTSSVPFWRGIGVGMQGVLIVMLILSVYSGTFLTDGLATTTWLLAGLCIAQLHRERPTLAADDAGKRSEGSENAA